MSTEKKQKDQGSGDPSLSQVRELLFGAQSRDFEERFERIEQEFTKQVVALREDMSQRLDSLEEALAAKTQAAEERLEQEQANRESADQKLTQTLQGNFSKRTAELAVKLEETERELRQHTLTQTQNLWEDLRTRYEDLSAHVENELEKTNHRSAERTALGEMFRQMADRLTEDSKASRS